jgi:hypothetical protein
LALALSALLVAIPMATAANASSLAIEGPAHADLATQAVFALADGRGLSWSATAQSVVVDRAYGSYTKTDHPALSSYGPTQTSTLTFQDAAIQGLEAREGGAILVRALGASIAGQASMPTGLRAVVQEQPRFLEFGSADGTGGDPSTHYYIDEGMPGRYVAATQDGLSVTLHGTFLLVAYGADYVLTSEGRTMTMRTGPQDAQSVAGVSQGTDEQDRITLVNATLTLAVPGRATLWTTGGQVAFTGTLAAEAAQALEIQGLRPLPSLADGAARYQGAATLAIAPASASALTIEGARATLPAPATPGASGWGLLVVAALTATAIGVVALLLARRRARVEDDTAAALAAMGERRHADAIAPLQRALLRRPHDALLTLDLAICLEEVGRVDEARRQYEATLARAPANAEALYYYARLLARQRHLAESHAHLAEALLLDPRLEEMARREPSFRGFTGVVP